jgi:CBS domain containing-hemolysin-like protein
MTNIFTLADLLVVIALIATNGFFVAAEYSIIRSHASKLREPDNFKKFGNSWSIRLVEKMNQSLSAAQLGITVASFTLGWYGLRIFQKIILDLFSSFGTVVASYLSYGLATIVALAMLVFFYVVVGELVAKSLAIRYPERTLRIVSGPVLLFSFICRPIINVFEIAARLLLKLFGVELAAESERVHSLAELALLVSHSKEQGVIEHGESEMLKGVFGFGDTIAREVMTPRTHLECIRSNLTFSEVLDKIVKTGYSRFPVIGKRIDDVKGILLARDLLPKIPEFVSSPGREFNIKSIMREAYFIPGTKPIDQLLNEFKVRKLHMAIVLDEHGGVDGIVTLEDLVEEIVGDIYDESDVPQTNYVVTDSGDILVDGGVLVDDINSRYDLEIPVGDYDTIAGFIFTHLGRMPVEGDKIRLTKSGQVFVEEAMEESSNSNAAIVGSSVISQNGHQSSDTEDSITEERKAIISVEKVDSNRIEFVRLHRVGEHLDSESFTPRTASQSK